jgi:glycosyltransferase involved in cell wall biosynthesis
VALATRDETSTSLEQFAIIYFGNDWSAENRTSSHHVAEHLGRRTSVLYVDSPGLRAPKASIRDFKKIRRVMASAVRPPRRIADRLWHMSLPQIPFRRLPLVRHVNTFLGRWLVKRAIARLGLTRTISWFAVPHPGLLANAFGEAAVIYYCIDDYAALPDVDMRAIAGLDAHLTSCADQVFVASTRMLHAKASRQSSIALTRHGVDVSLFRTAADPRLPIAPGAQALPRPIVGFFGLIEDWIDLDLIADLAERRPAWTFLMIGRLAVDPGRAGKLANVVFAGPQPYLDLPRWAKAFDVAIVPYRLTRQVVNAAPLKLREYLAAGRPVVAVPTPDTQRFAGLARLASGCDQFVDAIEAALCEDGDADRTRRMDAMAAMSWDDRVAEVVEIVEHRIRQKARGNNDARVA